MPRKSGFTLIELLVSVSIVAVLAVIGIAVYTKFLQNARDAKRQTDLRSIQSALEQYYADQLYYPLASTTCVNGKVDFDNTCSLKDPTGTKTYISNMYIEPVSSRSQYSYAVFKSSAGEACDNSTTNCGFYCIYASMENTPNSAPSGCSFSGTYNYGVSVP